MSRKLVEYGRGEMIVISYSARYGTAAIGGIGKIANHFGRTVPSLHAKMRNVVAMLKERGIPYCHDFSPLSGCVSGEGGRSTHWDVVEPMLSLERLEHLALCRHYMPV